MFGLDGFGLSEMNFMSSFSCSLLIVCVWQVLVLARGSPSVDYDEIICHPSIQLYPSTFIHISVTIVMGQEDSIALGFI
jgi:hypothetical protein